MYPRGAHPTNWKEVVTIDMFKYQVTHVMPGVEGLHVETVMASEYTSDTFADGTPSVVFVRDTDDGELKVYEVAANLMVSVRLTDQAALTLSDDIFDQDLFDATEPVEVGSISLLRPIIDVNGREVGQQVVSGPIWAGPLTVAVPKVPEADAGDTAEADRAPVGGGDDGSATEPSGRAVRASGPDGGPCGCGGDDCGQRSG